MFQRNRRFFLAAVILALCTGLVHAESVMPLGHERGNITIEDRIVTSPPPDAPDSRVFNSPANNSAFGVDLQGVSRIFLDTDPSAGWGSRCSGSLLWTGRHVLTAAHCVTDSSGTIDVLFGADGNFVTFNTDSGDYTLTVKNGGVFTHPSYDGSTTNGYDVAILELNSLAPSAVTRYDINRVFDAGMDATHVKAGYGRYGNGEDGYDGTNGGIDDNRRAGQNTWEDDGLGSDGSGDFRTSSVTGITNNTTQVTFDFDSGETTNDAFHQAFSSDHSQDLGFGTDEVNSAPGDSGGPSFISGTSTRPGTLSDYLIGGVTSYGLTFDQPWDSDRSGSQPDSSWGEFAVDARVSHDEIYGWIDATAPEPGALMLLVLGGSMMLLSRPRKP